MRARLLTPAVLAIALVLRPRGAGVRGQRRRARRVGLRVRRRVWRADAHDRFRTRGRRGAASVRGTTWLVEDRCDGSTSVRLKKGSVNFRDFVEKRTVVVKRGETYVARP